MKNAQQGGQVLDFKKETEKSCEAESQSCNKKEAKQKNTKATIKLQSGSMFLPVVRSFKKKIKSHEISFQDNFLESHMLAVRKIFKRFIEISLINEGLRGTFGRAAEFSQEGRQEESPQRDFDLEGNIFFSFQEKLQFLKDLEYEEKLLQFLKTVTRKFSVEISSELTYFAYRAWQQYLKTHRPFLSEEGWVLQAEASANRLSFALFSHPHVKYFNLSAAEQKKTPAAKKYENFQNFLKDYFITVFLVIQQFFTNPIADETSKRPRPLLDNFSFGKQPLDQYPEIVCQYHTSKGSNTSTKIYSLSKRPV